MRTIKKIIAFLCLNLALTGCLHFVLSSPAQYPILYSQCKKSGCNTLMVGHSFGFRGLDPAQLALEEGDEAWNMCIGGAPFHNIYYQIRDLHETSPLKRVFLELYWPYWTKSMYSADYTDFNNETFRMISGGARQEFIEEELLYENYNKTFFPYKLDVTSVRNLKDLPRMIRTKLDPRYRSRSLDMIMEMNDPKQVVYEGNGYFSALQSQTGPEKGYKFWHFEQEKISDQAVKDFRRIAAYCRKNGIELYCIDMPLLPIRLQNENHPVSHEFFRQLCGEEGAVYCDMNYVKFSLLPRDYRDYEDTDGHMNGQMARRHSRLLREILTSRTPEDYFEADFADVLRGIEEYESPGA